MDLEAEAVISQDGHCTPTDICAQPYNSKQHENIRQGSVCSFSVYRYLLSRLKGNIVHCDSSQRISNLKMMSSQLGHMEVLTTDVDEFIKNETVWQRIVRYTTRDPYTGEYPGNYMTFIQTGIGVLGMVAALGFGVTVVKDNRQFKKLNPYSYKERRYQRERVLSLIYNGTKVGMKVAWSCAKLFVPFIVISLGLTIIVNNTNPVNYALGFGVSSAMNHNLTGNSPGVLKAFIIGCAGGFAVGSGLYYNLHITGNLQERINRDSVRKKLYYESPSKYS